MTRSIDGYDSIFHITFYITICYIEYQIFLIPQIMSLENFPRIIHVITVQRSASEHKRDIDYFFHSQTYREQSRIYPESQIGSISRSSQPDKIKIVAFRKRSRSNRSRMINFVYPFLFFDALRAGSDLRFLFSFYYIKPSPFRFYFYYLMLMCRWLPKISTQIPAGRPFNEMRTKAFSTMISNTMIDDESFVSSRKNCILYVVWVCV